MLSRHFAILLVFLGLGSLQIFAEPISGPIYDTAMVYENPFQNRDPGCESCVDFYRVSRPVAPLVNHIFVGAVTHTRCGDQTDQGIFVYGASKGWSDLAFLRAQLESAERGGMERWGSACGDKAQRALDRAVEVSRRWQKDLSNWLYLPLRMIGTPLFGRPCANAAVEVEFAVKDFMDSGVP